MKVIISKPPFHQKWDIYEQISFIFFIYSLQRTDYVDMIFIISTTEEKIDYLNQNICKIKILDRSTNNQKIDLREEIEKIDLKFQDEAKIFIAWHPETPMRGIDECQHELKKKIKIAASKNFQPAIVTSNKLLKTLWQQNCENLPVPVFSPPFTNQYSSKNQIEEKSELLIISPLQSIEGEITKKSVEKFNLFIVNLRSLPNQITNIAIYSSSKKERLIIEEIALGKDIGIPIYLIDSGRNIGFRIEDFQFSTVLSFQNKIFASEAFQDSEIIVISRSYKKLKYKNIRKSSDGILNAAQSLLEEGSHVEEVLPEARVNGTSVSEVLEHASITLPLEKKNLINSSFPETFEDKTRSKPNDGSSQKYAPLNLRISFEIFENLKLMTHWKVAIASIYFMVARATRLAAYLLPMHFLIKSAQKMLNERQLDHGLVLSSIDVVGIACATFFSIALMWILDKLLNDLYCAIKTRDKRFTAHQVKSAIFINGNNIFFLTIIIAITVFNPLIGAVLALLGLTIYLCADGSYIYHSHNALKRGLN